MTQCVACGADAVRDWRTVRSFDGRAANATYLLRRCDECGTAVTEGRSPAEAHRLHTGGAYASPSPAVDRILEPLRRVGERASLAAIGSLPPNAAVLDLGAGDGRMLRMLKRHGFAVSGVEPFAPTADSGLGIERTTLEDADVPPESADVVLLWHVLEHLEKPERALTVASRALRRDGRLVVSVPSIDSLQARVGGGRWFHLDVPRHAVHFSRVGLARLLERNGLRVVGMRSAVIDQNLLGMTQTLLNLLTVERNVGFRALKGDHENVPRRDLAVTAIAAAPAAVAGTFAETLAQLTGRSGAIVVHAVRETA